MAVSQEPQILYNSVTTYYHFGAGKRSICLRKLRYAKVKIGDMDAYNPACPLCINAITELCARNPRIAHMLSIKLPIRTKQKFITIDISSLLLKSIEQGKLVWVDQAEYESAD